MPSPDKIWTAALVVIGDEILSGRTHDKNIAQVASWLEVQGIRLIEVRVVPDVEDRIVEAVNALRTTHDYLFTTGGIGPTHDDITADAVAHAFGVALYEDPGVIAEMQDKWELTPARRRMARIPMGGRLVRNPVQGPPGFTIGNVFVLAGVPSIMRGMLEDVGHRLKGGAVTLSRTVRVTGSGEGVIASPLETVARAHPTMSLGSYPFFGPEGYGSNLVIRGRDADEVDATVEELVAALEGVGAKSILRVEA